jgi:hypothetical protein
VAISKVAYFHFVQLTIRDGRAKFPRPFNKNEELKMQIKNTPSPVEFIADIDDELAELEARRSELLEQRRAYRAREADKVRPPKSFGTLATGT